MFKGLVYRFGRMLAAKLWGKFATPEVINKTVIEIHNRYPIAKKGIKKLYEVVDLLNPIVEGKTSEEDLKAFVQFIYRLTKFAK